MVDAGCGQSAHPRSVNRPHTVAHSMARVSAEPYALDLESLLCSRGIKGLVVTGVTAEVCVQTTVREANDRGFECLVLSDCIASYIPEFYEMTLKMITAQGGIFGWVSSSDALLASLAES